MSKTRLDEARRRLKLGIKSMKTGNLERAMTQFEDAHILGQRSTMLHTRSHWWMLRVAFGVSDYKEAIGQIPRIVAAMLFSKVWVPPGNSGRASVSAFSPMPIPEHLKVFVE